MISNIVIIGIRLSYVRGPYKQYHPCQKQVDAFQLTKNKSTKRVRNCQFSLVNWQPYHNAWGLYFGRLH
jgi:hypothetical protein